MSIVKCHESHYVGVLDNPRHNRPTCTCCVNLYVVQWPVLGLYPLDEMAMLVYKTNYRK